MSNSIIDIKVLELKFYVNKEQFLNFIRSEKISITKANVLYTQKFKGVVPNLIDKIYKQRVTAKNKCLDAKKKISEKLVPNFNFIKLNEHEYTNFDSYVKILHSNKLIVTLGSKGAKYMDELFPSDDPKETIDVSGAGDTFTASFILKYIESGDIKSSIIFANKMSSIVVSKRGVAIPN